jgi:hypothetical protein
MSTLLVKQNCFTILFSFSLSFFFFALSLCENCVTILFSYPIFAFIKHKQYKSLGNLIPKEKNLKIVKKFFDDFKILNKKNAKISNSNKNFFF